MRTNSFCTYPRTRKGIYTKHDVRKRFVYNRLESQQGYWRPVSNREAYLMVGQRPRFLREKVRNQGDWYRI